MVLSDVFKNIFKSSQNFDAMMSDILIEVMSNEVSLEDPESSILLLKTELCKTFNGKEVRVIGSFWNGLALSASAFDFFIDYSRYLLFELCFFKFQIAYIVM